MIHENPQKIFIGFLLSVFFIVLIRTAWVCDDAFITFRTIDNFFHGYGLRWNVDERVQTYTHPLWMMVMTVAHGITGEFYYAPILLSILISMITAGIVAYWIACNTASAMMALLLLILSKSFTDFSTSGLENPLSHLLLVGFWGVYFRTEPHKSKVFWLTCLSSLILLNRMDLGLLIFPLWIHAFWESKPKPSIPALLLASSPFLLWEAFSLFYYGFLLPNTAYAKFFSGQDRLTLWENGLTYFIISFRGDPITMLTLLAALISSIVYSSWKFRITTVGILLYLGYIFSVGGDFMSGRFFAAPFLFATLLIAQEAFSFKQWTSWFFMAFMLGIGLSMPCSPPRCDETYGNAVRMSGEKNGVIDERSFYYPRTGLLNIEVGEKLLHYEHAEYGRDWKRRKIPLTVWPIIGFSGFYAGPHVHIVDPYALGDPLLARLPTRDDMWIRVGHYTRVIPDGYIRTYETGEMQFRDLDLQQYYQHLSTVIRGPLWSLERCKEIFKINLGFYNHLIHRDYYRRKKSTILSLEELSKPIPSGLGFDHEDTHILLPEGVEIEMGSILHAKKIDVSFDHNDEYVLHFFCGDALVGDLPIPPSQDAWGMYAQTIELPDSIVETGYDRVRVTIVPGDRLYAIGHFIPFVESSESQ